MSRAPTEADVRARLDDLQAEKDRLIREARVLNDGARRARRDLTLEEHRRFNAILAEVDEITEEIRKGEDLIIAGRPSPRDEGWRRRAFSAGFPEKPQ